jgi:hypothetical protein
LAGGMEHHHPLEGGVLLQRQGASDEDPGEIRCARLLRRISRGKLRGEG